MTVDVSAAERAGLTTECEGRAYAFCRSGYQRAFSDEPAVYGAAPVEPSIARPITSGLVIIDDGMRRWYENCSCCLSDAYPDVKAALDAERAAIAMSAVEPEICEVAEAH